MKKTRLLRVLWVAMVLLFLAFAVGGFFIVDDDRHKLEIILIITGAGALLSGAGLSIIYIFTGSFAFPKLTEK